MRLCAPHCRANRGGLGPNDAGSATVRSATAYDGHQESRSTLPEHAAEGRNAVVAQRMEGLSGGLFGTPYGTPMARGALTDGAESVEGGSETAF